MKAPVMDPSEFRESGLLMMANLLFFHPRGYALSVTFDKDTQKVTGLGDILETDDPEGFVFGEWDASDQDKADRLENRRLSLLEARVKMGCFKNGIQPIGFIPESIT